MEEQTKEKYGFYDTIVSWACIIWAIASIILMFYFTGLNQVTFAIMTFGQLFLMLGIILLNRKKLSGALVLLSGLCCIIFPAMNEWGFIVSPTATSDNIFPIMLSTCITFIGLAMLVIPGVLEDLTERKCKKIVPAECVDLKEVTLSDDSVAYAPVYQYEVNGKYYIKCTGKYRKTNLPNIGHKMELKVNETNPETVYLPSSKASKMIIYIFGSSFFISGIGMLIIVLASL